MNRERFEKIIAPLLIYIGSIGAGLMCVAYIILVFVLIYGFKANDVLSITAFAIVNAVVGFCIMQMLKIQGISWAKEIPENKETLKQYYASKTKDKEFKPISYFWKTSVIKDVFVKCGMLAISTIGVIYIVVKGSKDYTLLGLAFVNLIMFLCFGLLSLGKAYDFFNNSHMNYIKQQLKQVPYKEEQECLTSETKNLETCKSK